MSHLFWLFYFTTYHSFLAAERWIFIAVYVKIIILFQKNVLARSCLNERFIYKHYFAAGFK